MDDIRYFVATVLNGKKKIACSLLQWKGSEGLGLFQRNKKVGEKEAGVSAVRTSSYSNHPFWQINSRVPMNLNNRVYSYLRESVPVIDVAICKIVRLCEGFIMKQEAKGLMMKSIHFSAV